MTLLALPLGLLLPTIVGYVLLLLLERTRAVFLTWERVIVGCLVGLTLTMFSVFLAHWVLGAPLTFLTFFLVQIFLVVMFGGLLWVIPGTTEHVTLAPSVRLPKWMMVIVWMLVAWTTLKILVAGITFLALVPTYLDDTLDNWNLRGKVFFVDHAMTLVMPGEDPAVSPLGVSSYPPTVPLVKVWLSTIAGQWSDPLVNSVHLVWYLLAIALVFIILRRSLDVWWSLLGAYALSSLPLSLMHGTNAYADTFVSAHVLLAAGMAYLGLSSEDAGSRGSYLRIGAIAAGLLPFTKNEGLLVYLPPLVLAVIVQLILKLRRGDITMQEVMKILAWYAAALLAFGLPWLVFKWSNGLTFGNAKPFTTLGIHWQENVLQAVAVNTFFEGNWLLLFPLLFLLILWKARHASGTYALLTCFFLIIYAGQVSLYLFTSLSGEALRQTGYARGLVQLAPVAAALTTLLLYRVRGRGLQNVDD